MKLILSYVVLAIAANIGSQNLVIDVYSGSYSVPLSVMCGTGVGLLVKYWLDQRYIFQFQPQGILHDSRTFMLYALTGLATTVIFWGFEFLFDHFFQTKVFRYIGGVIGLLIGYFAKYHLDKRFVFRGGIVSC